MDTTNANITKRIIQKSLRKVIIKIIYLILCTELFDSVADKIRKYGEYGHAFESHTNFFFTFQIQNILRSYLKFSTSYSRLADLKSLFGLFSKFYMAWRKNFTKIFTYWRGDVCPPMSRRCRHRLCPD